MTLSHSAGSSDSGGLRILMPALLTRISIRPSSPRTRVTMAPTAASSVTSAVTETALWPSFTSPATASADFASLRPTMAIAAPAVASPRAMPSPMPPLPPVTIATLPASPNGPAVMRILLLARFDCCLSLALALPDQHQAKASQSSTVAGPFELPNHEARSRPRDHAGALADPQHADGERDQAEHKQQVTHGVSSVAFQAEVGTCSRDETRQKLEPRSP